MEGLSLILVILLITLLGFALLMAALVVVLRFSQRWIDEYNARQGEGRAGPSAAELYTDSVRGKNKDR